MYQVWELCYQSMLYALAKKPVVIHSFVLMSNHYHLLVTTPHSDLDKFMEHFNKKLSFEMKKYAQANNHKFANRYKWTIIDSEAYLFNIYRYIYQNPIRQKLCDLCIDYPYSSLRFTPLQIKKLAIKTHIDYFKQRNWIEARKGVELDETIKKCLRKSRFVTSSKTRLFILQELNEMQIGGAGVCMALPQKRKS
jgi:putative transposase